MFDQILLIDRLNQILVATKRVSTRFDNVKSVDFFTSSAAGMEKLDAICMLLIAIGENLKKIDKITDKTLLKRYPQVDWKGAKGMRDIISHHYFDIDAEEIFWVCENNIPEIIKTLQQIIADISEDQ